MGGSRPRFETVILLAVTLWMGHWFVRSRDKDGPTARLSADAPYYHVYLPSLFLDRDLDLTNQYQVTQNWYRFKVTTAGKPGNVFGIGPALFEAPLFLAAHAVTRLSGAAADGFSPREVRWSLFGSVLATGGALFFAARLLRRRLGADLALPPVLLVLLGSPVVYYAVRQPGYAHPFATLLAAWFVDHWDASFAVSQDGAPGSDGAPRPRPVRTYAAFGLLLGLLALARPQLATWGILVPLALLDDRRRGAGRLALAGRAAVALTVAVGAFLPQFLAWKTLYGSFLIVPQGPQFMRWDAPAWSEILFSSRNGLLAWAPLLGLGLCGLVLGLRRHGRLGGALLLAFALQVVVNGAVWDWWGGGSFGGRRFDSCFVAFAFGLGIWFAPLGATEAPTGRPARTRRVIARATAGVVFLVAVLLDADNLALAHRTSSPSARIEGGIAAWSLLRDALPGPPGAVAAQASAAVTWPAREAFSLRTGAPRTAYDQVVGVHFLGDTYPGLNAAPPRRVYELNPADRPAFLVGFDVANHIARLDRTHGRMLIPLNRRYGPLHFFMKLRPPCTDDRRRIVVRWNGVEATSSGEACGQDVVVGAVLTRLRRGINLLDINAPYGTLFRHLKMVIESDGP